MTTLLFTDLVAVITGSGGGLGRSYALELAKRGAKVIINDLGGMKDGDGTSLSPANKVVNEIKAFGGEAYPNYDSVENGDKIIDCAIKQYGKIDILINNAGILRDKSFAQMSDEDWNRVHKVHLFGAYKTTKAAWEQMRSQKFGRIIFTSSAAGIYGNFGQANYSSAKLGLVGLCNTLAVEGSKYNITCNTIAPMAGSRLTLDMFPPEIFDLFKLEYVSPLVLYLCHPSNMETGGLFEVGAGWIGKVRWEVSKGVLLKTKSEDFFTPENIRDRWNEINDFSQSRHPSSVKESFQNFVDVLQSDSEEEKANDGEDKKTLENFVGKTQSDNVDKITFQNAILYAISVGITNTKLENLKYLYENHPAFSILPTYAVILCFNSTFKMVYELLDSPDIQFDLSQILHGEQYLEMFKTLNINENYTTNAEVVDVVDKIRGAIIIIDVNMFDSLKELVCKVQFTLYVSGAGGFKGKKKSEKSISTKEHPKRQPDLVVENYIDTNQAVLYRLNGDFNPLHIDPEISAISGFKLPILHGLCTFGIVAQQTINIFAQGEVDNFKKIKVRFSKPVTPGQTLITEFWKDGKIIYLQSKIKETGTVCSSGGYVELVNEQIKPKL